MHTTILSISTIEEYACDRPDETEVAESAVPTVDYVASYRHEDEKAYIAGLLGELEKNGCTVDREKDSFTVSDRDALARYLFSDTEVTYPHTVTNAAEMGSLLHEILASTNFTLPCVIDGEAYVSLLSALVFRIFTPLWDRFGKETFYIRGAYDCHY